MSIQFSLDNQHILTSVTHDSYQELILWDLPNFRYMRDNVKLAADKIEWFDSICSGSEDVRAIWENANIKASTTNKSVAAGKQLAPATVVNLSCHRLIQHQQAAPSHSSPDSSYAIASDTRGCLRLFRYPCYDIEQGFYESRVSSSAVNCCRFLAAPDTEQAMFVSSSLDGMICLWKLE